MPSGSPSLATAAAPLLVLACSSAITAMPEPVLAVPGAPASEDGSQTLPLSICAAPCCIPPSSPRSQEQEAAVQGLLHRLLPEHASIFVITVQGQLATAASATAGAERPPAAWFRAWCDGSRVHLSGSSGVEAATGLHWFLKEYCGASISWGATGGARLPSDECFSPQGLHRLAQLPPLCRTRVVPLQTYQNVVTSSYSMAWWGWERWEQEIDWMALQGINLPLAMAGQEWIWARLYASCGISAEELEDFFAGPAFLAWQRMGNLQGYAGPLPRSYMEQQAALQKRIVARMRALGMTPVLPAFAGFVPAALVRRFPSAAFSRASRWGGLPDRYCCPYMLDPLDPLFQELGAAFIREQRAAFGWEPAGCRSYYAADTFNEMRPQSSGPAYLASISAAVYQAMSAADAGAVWLMQAWLFFSDHGLWGPDQIKALLCGVPRDRLILLDLFAEAHPQWSRTDSFYGVPFIWVHLHNFGGNSDMYGALPAALEGFQRALGSGSSVVGLGLAPEGIEQNPVVYDFVCELPFRPEVPSLEAWFDDYARRRYGHQAPPQALQAWQLLRETVYDCRDGHVNTVMDIPSSRPGMSRAEIGLWGLHPHLWYDPGKVVHAWRLLAACGATGGGSSGSGGSSSRIGRRGRGSGEGGLASLPGYRYDLVDVGRNVLAKHSTQMWWDIVVGYYNRDAGQVAGAGARLLGLLSDLDALLATHPGFMMGPRIAEARAAGSTPAEADLHERNLRAQVTHWGTSPDGDSEVHDYASKGWAGLVGGYYRERWAQWVAWLLRELREGQPHYDAAGWRNHTVRHALAWALGRCARPSR